jgi:exodeoxyribonuclease VII large subunit
MNDGWPTSNTLEYTVSELSGALKRSVEDQFGFVKVRGELSGVKNAASGHLYFGLKDEKSVLDGICWRGQAQKLGFRPEDGLEVVCTGKLTTYSARSKYQMVVEHMEPAGAGALMALLDARRKKLAAEGLFDDALKKKIPYLPKVIGVVTSPTGAVIRDILHRLNDRFPRHVLVWPVLVQGEGAAGQIAAAVEGFNALSASSGVPEPDIIIVARGGGSIEDLWSFNEEIVVRAVANSRIPVISAVGHETDVTLVDFVSDLRAPTPTGAAEMAVPVKEDLIATVADLSRRLAVQKQRIIERPAEQLASLGRALPKPQDLLGLAGQKFDDLADRLPRGLRFVAAEKAQILAQVSGRLSPGRLEQSLKYARRELDVSISRLTPAFARGLDEKVTRFSATGRLLESVSFERTLDRGFVLVTDNQGQAVVNGKSLKAGDAISLRFSDTHIGATVLSGDGNHAGPPQSKRKPASKQKIHPKPSNQLQGKLF